MSENVIFKPQTDEIRPMDEIPDKHPFLIALGERLKNLRARKGLTRKALSQSASVSERHLANLEYGIGNASVLVLLQIAQALESPLSALLGDVTTSSPEWLMIRGMLENQDEQSLTNVRLGIEQIIGKKQGIQERAMRFALIGLRGAGKSSLGLELAKNIGFEFIELSKHIETLAGCSTAEIQALYGINAYRRYERRALEDVIGSQNRIVIATPGGLVSDTGTFKLTLDRCHTIWLKAKPEDHMSRVVAQGDLRPMTASKEAMDDLKGILAGRAAFYSKANLTVDTSEQNFDESLRILTEWVRAVIGRSVDD
jgi:XRE family transcriptional regulator, aerobic/anaerobic benzoate catabolism transcriptional regulator